MCSSNTLYWYGCSHEWVARWVAVLTKHDDDVDDLIYGKQVNYFSVRVSFTYLCYYFRRLYFDAIRYDALCTCVCSLRFQLKFYTFQNSHIYIFDLCLLIAICNRFVFDLHWIFKLLWIFHNNWISASGISSEWAANSWAKLRYDCTASEILLQFIHTNKYSVRPYVWIAVFLWCSSID